MTKMEVDDVNNNDALSEQMETKLSLSAVITSRTASSFRVNGSAGLSYPSGMVSSLGCGSCYIEPLVSSSCFLLPGLLCI